MTQKFSPHTFFKKIKIENVINYVFLMVKIFPLLQSNPLPQDLQFHALISQLYQSNKKSFQNLNMKKSKKKRRIGNLFFN